MFSIFKIFSLISRGDPYFTLHPLAVEEVHPVPHQVLVFHHVLTEQECEVVAGVAGKMMKNSGIGQDKLVSDLRLSQSYWIEDRTNRVVDKITQR